MVRLKSTAWPGVALAVLAAASGCGGPKVYPVRGTITFEGKPMKGGGAIAFMPLQQQEGKAPGGEIGEDGSYELTTHSPGDGSMPGEFRVVISQVTEREPENSEDGQKVARPRELSLPAADRIPTLYGDPYNSPLTATVEARDNELNFDLKRNPGPPGKGAWVRPQLRDNFAGLDRPLLWPRPQ